MPAKFQKLSRCLLANCVDDSDGCSMIENAHEQFCVEYGDKCANTCGQCGKICHIGALF